MAAGGATIFLHIGYFHLPNYLSALHLMMMSVSWDHIFLRIWFRLWLWLWLLLHAGHAFVDFNWGVVHRFRGWLLPWLIRVTTNHTALDTATAASKQRPEIATDFRLDCSMPQGHEAAPGQL